MNLSILPEKVQSIIVEIDEELREQIYEIKYNQDIFFDTVQALMDYYYPILYTHITGHGPSDVEQADYLMHLKLLMDEFVPLVHENEHEKYIYENIVDSIAKDFVNVYNIIMIHNNHRFYIDTLNNNSVTAFFANHIKTEDDYNEYICYINPMDIRVYAAERKTFDLYNMHFVDCPAYLYNYIDKLMYILEKYKQFIIPINFTFVDENNIFLSKKENDTIIIASNDKDTILSLIVRYLLKDKLLLHYNVDDWREHFAKLLQRSYIADDCKVYENYFISELAETNAEEYFINSVCKFILEENFINIAYKYIDKNETFCDKDRFAYINLTFNLDRKVII